jgi:hypothetical protein
VGSVTSVYMRDKIAAMLAGAKAGAFDHLV